MRDLDTASEEADPVTIESLPALPSPAPAVDAIRADPLGYLAHDRAAQRALADLLERIADGLPGADPVATRLAAALLRAGFAASAGAPEELALFAAVEPHGPRARAAAAVARRDHAERGGQAVELAEALDGLAAAGGSQNPETLGLLLRAFFDGLRRRLDWIEATIAPVAERLGEGELTRLGARLASLAEMGALRSWPGLVPLFQKAF